MKIEAEIPLEVKEEHFAEGELMKTKSSGEEKSPKTMGTFGVARKDDSAPARDMEPPQLLKKRMKTHEKYSDDVHALITEDILKTVKVIGEIRMKKR
ncbi:hypothetical protein R1flu_014537 [Riccia fluitans]|uniref:Uncharacterized protein n=1 Tax=Riccia fluitans TaxID=41844 RepID=A0ABD1YGD9_9MARC